MANGWRCGRQRKVVLCVLLAATIVSPLAATPPSQAKVINLAITLRDLKGAPVTLSQFKGKVIVLNLWATWCGPCRKEIPDLIKLQAAYPKDVAVIGVVVLDKFGEKVTSFVRDFGITYPVLDGNDREDFEDAFGPFWGLPTSFVIDRHGRLHKKHQGQVTRQQLEREIRPLIVFSQQQEIDQINAALRRLGT